MESIGSDDWGEGGRGGSHLGGRTGETDPARASTIGAGMLTDSVENELRGARAWEDRVSEIDAHREHA
eukprot:787867-Prorocentrum_minimum.AAC.2